MARSKLLFADDDIEDRLIITTAFGELGLAEEISFVENGEEVLQYLNGLETDMLPALIVLDLNMPKMNGTETLRALKQNNDYKDISVIIFSTSVNGTEKKACLDLGAISYVTKPLTYNDSITTARQFYEYVK